MGSRKEDFNNEVHWFVYMLIGRMGRERQKEKEKGKERGRLRRDCEPKRSVWHWIGEGWSRTVRRKMKRVGGYSAKNVVDGRMGFR